MSDNIIINTGNTLSINAVPGEDKRFPSVSTESIFTFGDFRIHRNITPNTLSANTSNLGFTSFGTLSSLSSATFDATTIINTTVNDLNPKKNDPNSYAYFGSYYTKIASAINNIIDKFPYAMLAYDYGTGKTLSLYTPTYSGTSILTIPVSAITNQGNIIYASGITQSASTLITLFNDYNLFEIQLSGSSDTHTIKQYSYDASTRKMSIEINGNLFTGTTASTSAIYIRPSSQRYYQYKNTLSNLEHQLLFEQKFLVPSTDDDTFYNADFIWPKTIDGFNPDSYGTDFDAYSTSLLTSCSLVDDIKTNWMLRTMLPEQYLELDSDGQIYKKLTNVYAEEFDKIKLYIDGLAYSHSVAYNDEETIPKKFIHKLSTLLGWEPVNEFDEVDIFEYLANEDSEGFTKADYNFKLWKNILININWLYKRKGTRTAIEFIFKLIGAPDCLINFNELVYKVQRSATGQTIDARANYKIGEDGFPNYNGSDYIFQEGGEERGNGDDYIRQFEPYFNPIPEVDNRKVQTGDTTVNGTRNIINSKEVTFELSPAAAIECDVKAWYDLGYSSMQSSSRSSNSNLIGGIHAFHRWTGAIPQTAIDDVNVGTINLGLYTMNYSSTFGVWDFTDLGVELDRIISVNKKFGLEWSFGDNCPQNIYTDSGGPCTKLVFQEFVSTNGNFVTYNIPVFWEAAFQTWFDGFLVALKEFLLDTPAYYTALSHVAITVVNRNTAELRVCNQLPTDAGYDNDGVWRIPTDAYTIWTNEGYTTQVIIDCITDIATKVATTFPNKVLVYPLLSTNQFVDMGDGRIVAEEVMDWLAVNLPEVTYIKETNFRQTYNIESDPLEYARNKGLFVAGETANVVFNLPPYYDVAFPGDFLTTIDLMVQAQCRFAEIQCDALVEYVDYLADAAILFPVPNGTSMTISQWIDYVYANSISPTNRKTVDNNAGHNFYYNNLKDIYLTYYLHNTTNQISNRLTFRKLETFLDLIQRNLGKYIDKLIPATTIIDGIGTTYRNTVFNRQKFVYPKGINDGSEFQIKAPLSPDLTINAVQIRSSVNDIISPDIQAVKVSSTVNDIYSETINGVKILNDVDTGVNVSINGVMVTSSILTPNVKLSYLSPSVSGVISLFPEELTPKAQPPSTPRQFNTLRQLNAVGEIIYSIE